MAAPSLLRVGDLLLAGGAVPTEQVGAIIEHLDNRGGTATIVTNRGAFTVDADKDVKRKERKERAEEDTPFVPMTVTAAELRVGDMVVAGGGVPADETGWGDSSVVQEASAATADTWTVRTETAEFTVPAEAILTVYHDVPDGSVNPDELDEYQRAVWKGIPAEVQGRMTSPELAAASLMAEDPVTPAAYQAAFFRNRRGVRVWHDPTTGKFAPAGFVSLSLLRRLWKGDSRAGMDFDDAVRRLRQSEPDITFDAAADRLLGPELDKPLDRVYQDAGRRRLRQFWVRNRRLGRSVPGEPLSPNEARARAVLDRVSGRQIDAVSASDRFIPPTDKRALRGADLSERSLAGVDLSGYDLRGADLTESGLEGANLTGADLTGADLWAVDLIDADLTGANLTKANLEGTTIRRSNLTAATLSGASFRGAHFHNADLSGADLSGADFRDANLYNVNFTGANLTGADLSNATDISAANLTGANLTGARLPDWFVLGDDGQQIDAVQVDLVEPKISLPETAWSRIRDADGYETNDWEYTSHGGGWQAGDTKFYLGYVNDTNEFVLTRAPSDPRGIDEVDTVSGPLPEGVSPYWTDDIARRLADGAGWGEEFRAALSISRVEQDRQQAEKKAKLAAERELLTDYGLIGSDRIARGMKIDLPYAQAGPFIDGTATADDVLNLLDRDRGVGIWWGLTEESDEAFDISDFQVYADYAQGEWNEEGPNSEWMREYGRDGSLSIVMFADRPTGWNPNENPDTSDRMIGFQISGSEQAYIDTDRYANELRLRGFQYKAGDGEWRTVLMQGDVRVPINPPEGDDRQQIDAVVARVIPVQALPDTPEMRAPGAVDAAAAELSRTNPDVNVFVTSAGFGPGLYGSRSVLAADINQSLRDGYWRNGEFRSFTEAARQRADRIAMREADAAALGRGGDGGQTLARQARRRQRLANQYRRNLDVASADRPVGTTVKLFGTRYTKQDDGSWSGERYDRETRTRTRRDISAGEYDKLRIRKRDEIDSRQSGQSIDALRVPKAVTDLIDRIRAVTGPVKGSTAHAWPMQPGELVNEPGMSEWEADGLALLQKLGQRPVGLSMDNVDLWAEIDFTDFDDTSGVGPNARILLPNSQERLTIDALMSAGTLYRALPDFDTESRTYTEPMYSLTWDAGTARWTARRSLGNENGPFVYGYSDDSAYEAMDTAGFRDENDRVFSAWLDTPNTGVQIDTVDTVAGPAVRPMSADKAQTAVSQIGAMTVAAISGGRTRLVDGRLVMPAGAGYQVRVSLAGDDTYTVERVFSRGGVDYPKGSVSGVYAAQLSEVAYRAALYSDGPFGQTSQSINLLNMPNRPYDNLLIDDERLVPYTPAFGPAPVMPTTEETREMARQISLADPDQYVTLMSYGGPDDQWLYQSDPVVQRQRRLSPFAPLHVMGWADGYWKNGEFTPFTYDDREEAERLSRQLFPTFYDDAADQPEGSWGEVVAIPRVPTELVLMTPSDVTVGGTPYDSRQYGDGQQVLGSLRYDPPPPSAMPPVTGARWTVRSPDGDTVGYLQPFERQRPSTGVADRQRWLVSTDRLGINLLLDDNYQAFTTPEDAARALLEGRVRLRRDVDTERDRLDAIRQADSERWRADAAAVEAADDVSIDLLVGDYVRSTRPELLRQRDEAALAESVRELQAALGAYRPIDPPRPFDGSELTAAAVWYNRDGDLTRAEIEAGVPTVQVLVGTNQRTWNRQRLVVMPGVQLADGRFAFAGPPSILYRTNVQRYQTGQAGAAWRAQIARRWGAGDVAVVTGVSEGGSDGPGAPVVLDATSGQTVDMMATSIAVYEVGGAVRDDLMGIESNDVDFAVTAPSYEAMKAYLEEQGFRIFQEKPEFVTIKAQPPEGSPLRDRTMSADFVLARRDGPSSDGRRPDYTEPGSLEDDLARRDFTVNAIARDLNGRLIDPHNGRADLENRVLRFVGDPEQRVREDGLRVLRGYRFMVTKGLTPEESTWAALTSPESAEMLRSVSKERIADELQKMFDYDTIGAVQLLGSLPEATLTAIFPAGVRLSPNLRKIRGDTRDRTIDPLMVDGWFAARPFIDDNGERLSWPEVSNRLTGGVPVIGFDETDGAAVRSAPSAAAVQQSYDATFQIDAVRADDPWAYELPAMYNAETADWVKPDSWEQVEELEAAGYEVDLDDQRRIERSRTVQFPVMVDPSGDRDTMYPESWMEVDNLEDEGYVDESRVLPNGDVIDLVMAPSGFSNDEVVGDTAANRALAGLSGVELIGTIGAMSTDDLRAALLSGRLDAAAATLVRAALRDRTGVTIDAALAQPGTGSVLGIVDAATVAKAADGDRTAVLKLNNRARLVREQNPSWDAGTVAKAVLGPAPSYKWEPSAWLNWDAARRHIRGERLLGREAVTPIPAQTSVPRRRWQWDGWGG